MYTDMDEWREVRYAVLRDGKSKRKVQRETGMHWKTLEKVLLNHADAIFSCTLIRVEFKKGTLLRRCILKAIDELIAAVQMGL